MSLWPPLCELSSRPASRLVRFDGRSICLVPVFKTVAEVTYVLGQVARNKGDTAGWIEVVASA